MTKISPAYRPPSDRFYSIVHWTFMGFIAAIVLVGRVAPYFINVPRPAGFRLFILAIVGMNVLWWSVADRRFSRHVQSNRTSALLRLLAAAFSIVLNAPIFAMLMTGRWPSILNTAPAWYAAAVTLWHILLVIAMPLVAGVRILLILIAQGVDRLRKPAPSRAHVSPSTDAAPHDGVDLPRRAFLKTSFATVPMVALVGGAAFSQTQNGPFQVNRRQLSAPWLPSRLRGLTLTHISDLHLGRLYRPGRLPELIDAVNKLDSDILIITGDVVDSSNEMLPSALEAFSHMRRRHGLFACIGNHDEFDNRREFVRLTQEKLPLLINERRTLRIGGERITIGGLDWASLDQRVGGRPGHHQHAQAMLNNYDPVNEGPMIVLAHHPHAWDTLALQGVPLTLSGHTHGGQIMLTPPDARPDAGPGTMLFRYVRGIYEKPGSALFVNRGIGNWFPVRINSPAEVVQIQLV